MGVSLLGVHLALRAAMKPLGLGSLQDPAALLLIGLGLAVTQLFLMPVTHGLSRRLEAQADRFALEKTRNPQAFIATMRRLAQQNLAEVSPPRWVEWLFYDHPSIARRIAMAEQFGGP
jgi:STE24 endopeptidase